MHQAKDFIVENSNEQLEARGMIFDYLKNLFGKNYNKERIERQLDKILSEHLTYTCTGILKALKYWYEVRNGAVEKSGYGLGIIPYIYIEAYDYYFCIWKAQQQNENKNIEDYKPKDCPVKITNPKLQPRFKNRFTFFDEEGNVV